MEKSKERVPPKGFKLVEMIADRHNVSMREAFDILVKVKDKNNGALKGMILKRFFAWLGQSSEKRTSVIRRNQRQNRKNGEKLVTFVTESSLTIRQETGI